MKNLNQSGGSLDGPSALTVTGLMEVSGGTWVGGGTVHINANATLNLAHNGQTTPAVDRSLTNHGTTTINCGDLTFAAGRTITNNAVMNITNNLTIAGGLSFTNNAQLTVNVPNDTATISTPFTNAGTFNIQAGTAEFTQSVNQTWGSTNLVGGMLRCNGTYTIGAGSSLTGTGSMNLVELVNNGTVSVGRAGNPLGSLQVFGLAGVANSGNYTQGMMGTLNLKVGGAPGSGSYNRLLVTGKATLAGALNITLVDGWNPPAGTEYAGTGNALMTWGSVAGTFMMTPPGWTVAYNATELSLTKN